MPKYLVETISMYRMRYAVEAESADAAKAYVSDDVAGIYLLDEFSQLHLSEIVSSCRDISTEEYLRVFDEDNNYLKDWTDDQKLTFVNKMEN